MAIQVRRGLKENFDPDKMLPGEWAVSVDPSSENQIVWMCFSAGVVKRMGTYDDFAMLIQDATLDIRDQYIAIFNNIKMEMDQLANETQENTNTVIQIRDDITKNYLPQIEALFQNASESAANAESSASEAEKKAAQASNYATAAKSFAHGKTGSRENEDVDNAEYYYEQAKRISQGLQGALFPMGTISFSQLKNQSPKAGYMYNISDNFITDITFKEGADHSYPAGTNVYWTADGYWDALAGTTVTSINGENGDVIIDPEKINAVANGGDIADNIVSFTSDDSDASASWTNVSVLSTEEKLSSAFKKISTMFKNIRYLYKMLGTTNISSIGGGTVTGAISALNTDLAATNTAVSKKQDASTAITNDNIGEQFVAHARMASIANEANSAASADAVIWDNITGKPNSYPPSHHTHEYLPLTGGTISGELLITNSIRNINGDAYFRAKDDNFSVRLTGKEVRAGNTAFNAFVPMLASAFTVNSSKLVKENVSPMSDDEARKILQLTPVDFDYIPEFGGKKGCHGLIAEDTMDIIPSCVEIPEGYSVPGFIKEKGIENQVPSVDYAKLVPYLIKMVQILQADIEELRTLLNSK